MTTWSSKKNTTLKIGNLKIGEHFKSLKVFKKFKKYLILTFLRFVFLVTCIYHKFERRSRSKYEVK